MTADDIVLEFNKIGIYEVNNAEIEYTENPKHIKVMFYIDFKEEFINCSNDLLRKFLINNCRFEDENILDISKKKYCVYSFVYEDGKIHNDFKFSEYMDKLIFVFVKAGLEPYLNRIFY